MISIIKINSSCGKYILQCLQGHSRGIPCFDFCYERFRFLYFLWQNNLKFLLLKAKANSISYLTAFTLCLFKKILPCIVTIVMTILLYKNFIQNKWGKTLQKCICLSCKKYNISMVYSERIIVTKEIWKDDDLSSYMIFNAILCIRLILLLRLRLWKIKM